MSKTWKVTGFVAILLAVMVMSHYVTGTTPEELSANKHKTEKPQGNAANPHGDGHGKPVVLPKPIGAPDAVVKIKVFVTSDNSCDTTTVNGMKDIANKYPGKVFVKFMDLNHGEAAAEAQAAKISCKSGLTINGLSILRIPGRGVKGLVMFDGPMGEKNYNMGDVDAAVAYLISKGAGKDGKKAAKKK